MAMMFSGVFVVFLSAWFGPRRILIPAAGIFTIVSVLLPFAKNYTALVVLIVIAGLASGTFYSLTMTFVLNALPKRLIIFGIAAYASDIVFVSNIAPALEGWYMEHLSWHWIFRTAAVVTPLMMICVHLGIPARPPAEARPSWHGFVYLSLGLALLYGALDQGERLDWLNSGIVVATGLAGLFLLLAAAMRRMLQPNPVLDLSFLNNRNTIVLAFAIFAFRFVHLATVVLVPRFSCQRAALPSAGNRPRAGLGCGADARSRLARGRCRYLHTFPVDPRRGTDPRRTGMPELFTCGYLVGGE